MCHNADGFCFQYLILYISQVWAIAGYLNPWNGPTLTKRRLGDPLDLHAVNSPDVMYARVICLVIVKEKSGPL